jgi:hypothetical protein
VQKKDVLSIIAYKKAKKADTLLKVNDLNELVDQINSNTSKANTNQFDITQLLEEQTEIKNKANTNQFDITQLLEEQTKINNKINTISDILDITFDEDGNIIDDTPVVTYEWEDYTLSNSHCATLDGIESYIQLGVFSAETNYDISGYSSITDKTVTQNIFDNRTDTLIGVTLIIINRKFRLIHNNTIINSSLDCPENTFFKWRVVWDGTRVTIYINGSAITTTLVSSSIPNNALLLGSRSFNLPAGNMNGNMYNVSVNSDDSLIGEYPMAEGAGNTIYDISGNNNHGTAVNTEDATFWGSRQDEYHYNITKGFTLSNGVKVPALSDGTADALGNTITNPSLTPPSNSSETLVGVLK